MFSIKDKCLLLIIIVSIFNSSLQAQDSVYMFKSAGGVIGYGHQINLETRYNPVFFAGDFSWQFGKKKRKEFVAFYLEPQFNLVATIRPVDIEFGSNIGIRYYQQLSPGFNL